MTSISRKVKSFIDRKAAEEFRDADGQLQFMIAKIYGPEALNEPVASHERAPMTLDNKKSNAYRVLIAAGDNRDRSRNITALSCHQFVNNFHFDPSISALSVEAVQSSLSNLKTDGFLQREEKINGKASYSVTDTGLKIILAHPPINSKTEIQE